MAGRKLRDADDARACLDAVAQSGLPSARWAQAHGIDGRSLNAWRLNLTRARPEPDALRLVELVARTRTETPVSGFRVACGPFVVEVPPAFDEEALSRLLVVVAAC